MTSNLVLFSLLHKRLRSNYMNVSAFKDFHYERYLKIFSKWYELFVEGNLKELSNFMSRVNL